MIAYSLEKSMYSHMFESLCDLQPKDITFRLKSNHFPHVSLVKLEHSENYMSSSGRNPALEKAGTAQR